jgi:UPF0755 protein
MTGDQHPDSEGASTDAGAAFGERRLRSPRAALQPDPVPLPKIYSKRARHPLVIAGNAVFTAIILLGLLAGGAFFYGRNKLEAPGPLTEDKIVNIQRKSGIRDIADQLQREGVTNEPWWVFVGGALVLRAKDDLKAGEYQFAKNASLHEVINTITEGKVVLHPITIPEGLTSEQIVQRLLETDVLAGNVRSIPREGSLLPETYRFPRDTAREQVLQRMEQQQKRVVQEIWERRSQDLPLKSPDELVTLASIVEKETGKPEERSRVAAVFVNRLKQKMRLQSDPTIIYGLVGGKGALGRPILRSEIEQATPYNTYTRDGLPPGPIANPGRASLEATANPARTKEIFFVADGTGGHAFSENLEQHQKNVARLRAIEQGKDPNSVDPSASSVPTASAASPQQPAAAAAKPRSGRNPTLRQQTQ